MENIVTLTTDFGLTDAYVGAMRGAALTINPNARLIDITHEVPRHDIVAGAFLFSAAWPYFPAGTVHVVVVDPGVGTSRRALAARGGGHFYVGPDNGVLTPVWERAGEDLHIVRIDNPVYMRSQVSHTFHGRDVFAPVAAYLSMGMPLSKLGPEIHDPIRVDWPQPERRPGTVIGEVIYVDHFGNLITNVTERDVPDRTAAILCRDRLISHISRAYADEPHGEALALFGSAGFLEISINGGNAANVLNLNRGDQVMIRVRQG